MNAESTVFRSSRSAVVVAPGARAPGPPPGCWPGRCGWPRRRWAAGCLPPPPALVLVVGVWWLYDSADQPRVAATFRPAGGLATGGAAGTGTGAASRQMAAAPVQAKRAAAPAEVAAAWWAARQKVAVDKVQALQQRRVAPTRSRCWWSPRPGRGLPSDYVTVRKGSSGWKVS